MSGGNGFGKIGRGLALLVAGVAAGLCLLPATATAQDPAYGVSVSPRIRASDLDRIASGGVQILRVELSWEETRERGGDLNWSHADRFMRLAAERDMSVVPYLTGTPSWAKRCRAKHGCRAPNGPSPEGDGWLRFVAGAVARYGSGGDFWTANPDLPSHPVSTWQVWNAINLRGSAGSPRRYGKLLGPTYRTIKLADPEAEVLTGALLARTGKKGTAPADYLRNLLKTGARYSFSGLAVRPEAGTVGHMKGQLGRIRRTLADAGRGQLGIWVTPIGWASDRRSSKTMAVGPIGQKKRLANAFEALREGSGVDGVFWTRWRDGSDGCKWCRRSGLADRKGRPKPSWAAFRRFLNQHVSPPPPPPPPPDDREATLFGVVPEAGKLTAGDLAYMKAAAVGSVRLILNWQAIQPTTGGSFRWDRIDEEMEDLARTGIVPLPQLFGDKSVITDVQDATTMNRWRTFVAAAVNRYKPGSPFWRQFEVDHPGATAMPPHVWQVYNEQNIFEYWPSGPSPNKYAVLLDASAKAIRGADPTAKIMLGGMHGDDNMNGVPSWTFLKLLYEYPGAADDFDIVAVHPYAFDLEGMSREISAVRDVMTSKGDEATPIWVTEMGWSSELDPNKEQWWERTPAGQAAMLTSAWNMMLANREAWNLHGVYWYTWRDPATDLCNFCSSAGLLQENFVPKPSYSAFSKIAHSG